LPAHEVEAAHRIRLTEATIRVVAHKAYRHTTVADIVASARVSRVTFYRHFADKGEAFLAACFEGLGELAISIGQRMSAVAAQPPEEILRASVAGFLRFLADRPDYARCFLLEMPGAGEEAHRRLLAVSDLMADNTRRWHRRALGPQAPAGLLDEDVYRLLSGGAVHLCTAWVHAGRTAQLPDLEAPIMQVHLAMLMPGRLQ
jgi:AcrR family transcriptional regulator